MGRGRGMHPRRVLIQQVPHVERRSQPPQGTPGKRDREESGGPETLFPARTARHLPEGKRQGAAPRITGTPCGSRFLTDGCRLCCRTGTFVYPVRSSGNRQVADHHQPDCQCAFPRQACTLRGREDGRPQRGAESSGQDRTRPVLSGDAFQQGDQAPRAQPTGKGFGRHPYRYAQGISVNGRETLCPAQQTHRLSGSSAYRGRERRILSLRLYPS